MNNRNKYKTEADHRIAKSNYGSRLNYLIEDAILEKRLIYNNSIVIGKYNIHNMTDLQSCYDRQLAEIGSIVEESVGVQEKAIKTLTKVLSVMNYFMYTSFGVSQRSYSRLEERQADID